MERADNPVNPRVPWKFAKAFSFGVDIVRAVLHCSVSDNVRAKPIDRTHLVKILHVILSQNFKRKNGTRPIDLVFPAFGPHEQDTSIGTSACRKISCCLLLLLPLDLPSFRIHWRSPNERGGGRIGNGSCTPFPPQCLMRL